MDCFYTEFSYHCTNFTPLLMQGEDRFPGQVGTETLGGGDWVELTRKLSLC